MQQTRLMRSETDKMIAGVCGGLATYLGVDPVLVRLAFVILLLASGIGFVIYIILWGVTPTPSSVNPEIRIMSSDFDDTSSNHKTRFSPAATVGVILILFGIFFLSSQIGGMPNYVWPLVLIAAGLYYLVRRTH